MLTLLTVLAVVAITFKVVAIIAGTYLAFRAYGWVHRSNPALARILVVCVVGVALVGSLAAVGLNYLKRAKVEARAEAAAERRKRPHAEVSEAGAERARAAVAERKSRAELIDRWRAARSTALRQWREDLVAASAVGSLGEAPPMLSVEDNGALVTITNRAKNAACVLVTRVATRDSKVLSRCTVGGNRCVVIQAGATARWATLRTGNSESCLTGTLEYRVGNFDYPDPSWWSESALGQFGTEDPDPVFVARWSDAALITEIVRLEKQIENRMRVER